MTALDQDLGLQVSLRGLQLIEASAGTGKTFTLATIHSRLVIEQRLPVSEILAVTFTEAATKELRERLRERLLLALTRLDSALPQDDPAAASTQALLDAAIAREGRDALRHRLRVAVAAMDLAPIHTIHGFCRRALADHALEAGQPLIERALIENETALREEVAAAFWRLRSRNEQDARLLRDIWGAPKELARSLRGLLTVDVLLPQPEHQETDADAALMLARQRLTQAFLKDGEAAYALVGKALADKSLNNNTIRSETFEAVWRALRSWRDGGFVDDPIIDSGKIGRFTDTALKDATSKKGVTPVSPFFAAIEDWLAARHFHDEVEQHRRVALVHDALHFARERLDAIKQQRGLLGYDDMIRGVADALAGAQGEAFATCLRKQYRVALLDEFQDTDARQWAIFAHVFAAPDDADAQRALFLIGDPKQSIYRFRGGDVFTYLAAAGKVGAGQRHSLTHNFRSRPALLTAVQALFDLAGTNAFAQPGIAFTPVIAGDRNDDAHLQRDGVAMPALTVLTFDQQEGGIEKARECAAGACVAAIRELLVAGAAGRVTRQGRDGHCGGVRAGDIAILVERHDDGARMQRALAAAGIASVAAGKLSLYQTDEARHLRWLFAALREPGDDARLRAALAAPLFGLDALAIAALDADDNAHRQWQDRLQHWRERSERHGPLALLNDLCADNAARLLNLRDGERRLTNYLQLAEALQDADARIFGLAGLCDFLDRRIADADAESEGELLRLESDAERVKILTLHKSKGLEFELVFLPFVATGGNGRHASTPAMASFHDGTQRVAQLYPEKQGQEQRSDEAEERAEDLRLLYVGLTRARLATWLAWGPATGAEKTALAWLLHRDADADKAMKIDAANIGLRLDLLRDRAAALGSANAIAIVPVAEGHAQDSAALADAIPGDATAVVPPAAIAQRMLDRDWWIYSFSQLARADAGAEERGAGDEVEPAIATAITPSRFAGARFGNSLHTALELADTEAWRDWRGELPPPGQLDLVAQALREQGYASEADQNEGVPLLTALIANTVNVRLPEGARLAALPREAQCAEMEFHLALAPTAVTDFLALLHAHGLVSERTAFGARRRLEGLLTGFIDLVYEHAGRYYVLDYKSNQLRDYAPATLAQAVRDSEYDLQYVIYSLALHRWLRFRLGTAYDPTRHLGGVRYLFCRGLDALAADSPGIHALTLPVPLLESLDRLFALPSGADA